MDSQILQKLHPTASGFSAEQFYVNICVKILKDERTVDAALRMCSVHGRLQSGFFSIKTQLGFIIVDFPD